MARRRAGRVSLAGVLVGILAIMSPPGPAGAQASIHAEADSLPAAGPDTVVRRQRGHPDVLGAFVPAGEAAAGWEPVAMQDGRLYHRWRWWDGGPRAPVRWPMGSVPEVPGLFPRADCRRAPGDEADYLIPLLAPPLRCRLFRMHRHPARPGVRGTAGSDTVQGRSGREDGAGPMDDGRPGGR